MGAPLAGRHILVTRAAHQAGKLSEGLHALGAEPVEVPVLEIRPPDSFGLLDRALRDIENYDWLILTSANTVRALAERAIALSRPLDRVLAPKVAAVGEATAAAARNAGLPITVVPETYIAESLVGALLQAAHEVSGHDLPGSPATGARRWGGLSRAESVSSKTGALAPEGILRGLRFLLARAEIARDVIPDALRAAGAQIDVVDAYRNVLPESAPEKLRAALAHRLDAATFTSSSSVTHLAEAAKRAGVAFPLAGVPAISIGPITSKTLREMGWEPAEEAERSDISGLVEAVLQVLARNPSAV